MSTALAAGIGVAAVSVSAAPSHAQPDTRAAAHTVTTTAQPPAVQRDAAQPAAAQRVAGPVLAAKVAAEPVAAGALARTAGKPTLAFVRALRKDRPVLTIAAAWVNPLPEASVTSCFGIRWGRLHAGVDLAAPNGTPIRAAGAGTVVAAGPEEGYGNAVLIDHGDGYLTHYAHLSVVTVTAGERVSAGQHIGDEGSTGHSTGPHLHFEVHRGHYKNPIEPTQWLHTHGVDIPGCVTFTG